MPSRIATLHSHTAQAMSTPEACVQYRQPLDQGDSTYVLPTARVVTVNHRIRFTIHNGPSNRDIHHQRTHIRTGFRHGPCHRHLNHEIDEIHLVAVYALTTTHVT